jgi:hypothetical protein
MKIIFQIFLASLFANPAMALSISSRYNINSAGAYYKEVQIQCAVGEEILCQQLCAKDTDCNRIEPYCLNCAGTSSLLLRTLFTQIALTYKPTTIEIPTLDFVNYMATQNYILLGANSVYNFYRPVNSPELLQSLLSFCPAGDEEALLAVDLDAENEPAKLSFVICKASDGISRAFQVDFNHPEISEKPLALKVKWNLKLR